MPNPPSLLNRQPPHIKAQIAMMAKTHHYAVIVDWLNDQDIPATYNQLRHYISTKNVVTRLQEIPPVITRKAKVQTYIGALLEYEDPTYTINNLRLRGPSWSEITIALRRSKMIEAMRDYSPIRWRILATKDELRDWMAKEIRLSK